MGDEVVHRAEGSATSGAGWWWLIVLGVIGALTTMCVAFAIPSKVGPWWLWLAAVVPFVLLGRWELRRSAVVMEVVARGGELRVRVSGRGANVDEPITGGVERWVTPRRIPVRQGGGTMMHFNVTLRCGRGRRLAFRQMGGGDARGWPEREPPLGDGPDIFLTLDIFGLERALRERGQAAARAGSAP